MFKYEIRGKKREYKNPAVLALTSYKDIAEYIRDHAVEALDPNGTQGFEITIIEHPGADYFIYPRKGVSTDDNSKDTC